MSFLSILNLFKFFIKNNQSVNSTTQTSLNHFCLIINRRDAY